MKILFWVLLPLIGAAFLSRALWCAVLAVMANIWQNQVSTKASATEPQKTCYGPSLPAFHSGEKDWSKNEWMITWGEKERAVQDYIRRGGKNFSELEKLISEAYHASTNAAAVVNLGLISEDAYNWTIEILAEWHKQLALANTNVECYEAMIIQPMVSDVNARLMEMEDLYKQGKLTSPAVKQVEADIEAVIKKYKTPETAGQITKLLSYLLDYDQTDRIVCYYY